MDLTFAHSNFLNRIVLYEDSLFIFNKLSTNIPLGPGYYVYVPRVCGSTHPCACVENPKVHTGFLSVWPSNFLLETGSVLESGAWSFSWTAWPMGLWDLLHSAGYGCPTTLAFAWAREFLVFSQESILPTESPLKPQLVLRYFANPFCGPGAVLNTLE